MKKKVQQAAAKKFNEWEGEMNPAEFKMLSSNEVVLNADNEQFLPLLPDEEVHFGEGMEEEEDVEEEEVNLHIEENDEVENEVGVHVHIADI